MGEVFRVTGDHWRTELGGGDHHERIHGRPAKRGWIIMPPDMARELIDRMPGYEFRSAGKLCTACGTIIGNVRGDDQIHEQWHAALAAMLGGARPS
ncbi:MAG: hypothetical protein ACRDS0_08405 [Pseudonocardiaceae bacterium]